MGRFRFAVIVAVFALGVGRGAAAQLLYSVTDLGTLGGATSDAWGINASGQATGDSFTTGNTADHAFLYSGGHMSDLGTLGGNSSVGYGINASGQVTGYATTSANYADHAFLYSNGAISDLGGNSSVGYGINASGQVTGYANTSANNYNDHAYLYSNGVISDLGTLGGSNSMGYGINDGGQVTGFAYPTSNNGVSHAFLYSNGAMSDLGTLGGTTSYGQGINDGGQVTGAAYISGNHAQHAFLYSSGVMSDLGTLGGTESAGYGINASGQVTGWANTVGNATHAFLFSDGVMHDLNALTDASGVGWHLTEATGINNAGQIVGNGGNPQGQGRAFLLTPHLVTQPTTQTPVVTLTSTYKPTSSNLLVFDSASGKFQPLNIFPISSSEPTVVLTHGWNLDGNTNADSTWDATASALHAAEPGVNIVAWNWSNDASGNLSLAASRVANEGKVLGDVLNIAFGPSYAKPVHFIGHSLVALVDSKAIDVLHGDQPAIQIQDTLLDEASIANQFVTTSYQVNAIPSNGSTIRIDNYMSSFGNIHREGTNVLLTTNPSVPAVPDSIDYWVSFHGYPITWFDQTIPSGAVGYAGGIERSGFNPNDPTYQPDTYWAQDASSPNTVSVSDLGKSVDAVYVRNNQELDALAKATDHPYANYYLNSSNNASIQKFGVPAASVTGAIQYENLVTVKLKNTQNGLQTISSPEVVLGKQPSGTALAPAPMATLAPFDPATLPTSSSYAWIPLTVPQDMRFLTLDFTFSGLSPGDFLSVGVNDTPLFQLESEFVTDGITTNTGLLDVSQWTGQDVNIFLGLNATDDNNAGGSITIDNISFASVPEPSAAVLVLMGAGWWMGRRANRRTSRRH